MRRRADPARSKVDLPRIGFRIGDELGDVVSWDRQVYLHHVSQSHRPGNRDAVADEVEGKPFVERRVDGVVRADEDDSVTIWRSAECGLHADIAARTDPVLDDELLAQMIRQILADDARNDVVGAARRKANNPVHRPCRIGLRPRDARKRRESGGTRCQMQKSTTGKFHAALPEMRLLQYLVCNAARVSSSRPLRPSLYAARVSTAVWNGSRLSIASTLCVFTSHLNIRSTILSDVKSAMVKPCCSIGFTSSSMSR